MKDVTASDKVSSRKHSRILENLTPTKTTRIRGYGLGVTFTTSCFLWDQTFSGYAALITFTPPSLT